MDGAADAAPNIAPRGIIAEKREIYKFFSLPQPNEDEMFY